MENLALPVDAQHGPNCGLTALAVVAGVTLAEATAAYIRQYPNYVGSNWKGGTRWTYTMQAAKHLGVRYVDDTPLEDGYNIRIVKRMSLKTFVKKHTIPGKRYMIRTTGHVQVVQDGMVIDQGGVRHIDEYRGAGKIVKDALRIV
ncbi:hypothetical protein K0U83_07930 [bacterium]|nr:hypothetical protein [bacterium]